METENACVGGRLQAGVMPRDLSEVPASEMTLEERLFTAAEIAREMLRRYDDLATTVRTFLYDIDAHSSSGGPPLELKPHMWMQVQAFRNLLA